jgi:hypothetical protein
MTFLRRMWRTRRERMRNGEGGNWREFKDKLIMEIYY